MRFDKVNNIGRVIRRLLDWLSRLVGGKAARAQPQCTAIEGAARPEARVDVIAPLETTTTHEAEDKTSKVSDQIEPGALDKTISISSQNGEEPQRDRRSEPEIEPTGETISALQPPAQPPTHPTTDQHAKTWDLTTIAPERLQIGVPESTTPEKVESGQGRDDGTTRPKEEARKKRRSVIPPEERGGRPRRGSADREHGKPRRRLPATSRPEIICWKRGPEWVVGVEGPDDISQDSISVLQANEPLSEDDFRAGCWPLATLDPAAKVQVVVGTHNRKINLPLGDGEWLLFKLSGTGLEQGRMVKHVSSGSYLAIVPKNWQRDEEKAGSPPTTPEPTFLEGYLAHFFELTQSASSRIAFRDQLGQSIVIDPGGPRFYLDGLEIHDQSEQMGPLFGSAPPRLGIINGHWSDVQTIVVGQEGSGRQRWRASFEPKADLTHQELPHQVLKREAGWYFVRFYDSAGQLIDSLDFRFVAGLKKISIPAAGPIPLPDGHVAQTVEVHHDAGYHVKQAGKECPDLKVEWCTDKTILTIPPTAQCDRTRWYIFPADDHGKKVEFTILVERLWWSLSSDDKEPSRWEDRPVQLRPEDFSATSDRAIWLRLPKPGWVSDVAAGFRRGGSRCFSVKVTDHAVPIPLREFAGVRELDDRATEHQFKVWAEIEQNPLEVTVGILPAVAQVTPLLSEWGRYKNVAAEARLYKGSGQINVNGLLLDQYFINAPRKVRCVLEKLCGLPLVMQTLSQLDLDVTVRGSSPKTIRQAKAVAHAIARALWHYDRKLMSLLKQAGFGGASVRQKQKACWLKGGHDESR